MLKENVDSWYCFLDIAERKPCARELCSSYNLLDVNTRTMVFICWFQSLQESPSHRKCSWDAGREAVCLGSPHFQWKAFDPCGVQRLWLFINEGPSETSGLAVECRGPACGDPANLPLPPAYGRAKSGSSKLPIADLCAFRAGLFVQL